MVISLSGKQMYISLAVDGEGEVLKKPCSAPARQGSSLGPARQTPSSPGHSPGGYRHQKLRSYGSAIREIGFSGSHEQGLRANNRTENSHQPIRRRERKWKASNRQSLLSASFRRGYIQCPVAFDRPSDRSTVSNRRASISEQGYS
jgi:transposase-like protein